MESQRSIETVKELRIYPASEIILNEDAKVTGLKKIRTEAKKVEEALRKEMKTEEAYRLKTTVEEFLENLDVYSGMAGIESYISYFYEEVEYLEILIKKSSKRSSCQRRYECNKVRDYVCVCVCVGSYPSKFFLIVLQVFLKCFKCAQWL